MEVGHQSAAGTGEDALLDLERAREDDVTGRLARYDEGSCFILWMDDIHFAPPKSPGNDDSPVNATNIGFPWLLGAGFRGWGLCEEEGAIIN